MSDPDTATMVPIHATFQLFAVLITAATLAFYLSQMRAGNKGDWEPIYVSAVEFLCYAAALVLPDGYAFRSFGSDITVPVFRYFSWLCTCPIILKVLVTVISPADKIDQDLILRLMLTITWVELLGFLGSMYVGIAKTFCITLSIVVCIYMYYVLCAAWNKNQQMGLNYGKERFELLALLMVSWIIFPVLYIVGPEGFHVISNHISIIGHVIGDVIAKNLWGLLAWKLRLKIIKEPNNTSLSREELSERDLRGKVIQMKMDQISNPESIKGSETYLQHMPSQYDVLHRFGENYRPIQPETPPNKLHVHNFLLEHYLKSVDKSKMASYDERKAADTPSGSENLMLPRANSRQVQQVPEEVKQQNSNNIANIA